jgi:hypothetical protein
LIFFVCILQTPTICLKPAEPAESAEPAEPAEPIAAKPIAVKPVNPIVAVAMAAY